MIQHLTLLILSVLVFSCGTAKDKSASSTESGIIILAQSPIEKIVKSDAEWKAELTQMEDYVLREKGTERAFTGDWLLY